MVPEQIDLIKESWAKVVPIKETAADLFYDRLFELDPTIRPLFKKDLTEQKRKLVAMLNRIVTLLGDFGALVHMAEDLGRRHVSYGVEAEHYDTVGTALLWTLRTGLGAAFTPEVEAAWTAAYRTLAGAMKEAAYGVPSSAMKKAA
jgi:hemoglobin-like flavoprotein